MRIGRVSLPALVLLALAAPDAAQTGRADELLAELELKRLEWRLEASQRHLELGLDCRDDRLASQASVHVLRAIEISRGENRAAQQVLARMRELEDDFWKRRRSKPSRSRIAAYLKKAEKVRRRNLKDRLELAAWADRRGLDGEARAEAEAVLQELDDRLRVDSGGRIRTSVGSLPRALSQPILDDAVQINGEPHLRDVFLARLSRSIEVWEHASDELRVRSTTSSEEAGDVHALASALLPHLEADLGGRPDRRPTVFLFSDRRSFGACLAAAGLGESASIDGVADNASRTALVCTEGLTTDRVRATVLHELTHLFQYGVSPTVMPSWYTEGLADTWGGQGTFRWQDGKLELGGLLSAHRVEPLLEPEGLFPLIDLVRMDARTLWGEDPEAALRFYAQAWAFLRFLRTDAGKEAAADLARWEEVCRGAALGAEAGRARSDEAAPSIALFEAAFGAERLNELEPVFAAWLGELY